jgi:anthranilate phosphoribosyltransferase
VARQVLEGGTGAARDMVLANAAAGLLITERVASLPEGVAMAGAALDEGLAAECLQRLAAVSTAGATT